MDASVEAAGERERPAPPSRCTVAAVDGSRGVTVVTVSGDLDLNAAAEVTAAVDAALASGARRLEIDLRAVPFIDSAGLQALINAYNAAVESEASITFTNAQPMARRIASVTGLDGLLS